MAVLWWPNSSLPKQQLPNLAAPYNEAESDLPDILYANNTYIQTQTHEKLKISKC